MVILRRIIYLLIISFLFCLPVEADQKVEVESLKKGVTISAVTVSTSAVALPTTAQRSRKTVLIVNDSDTTIYLGDASVTTATGTPLYSKQAIAYDITEAIIIYGIAAVAGNDVRVMEFR